VILLRHKYWISAFKVVLFVIGLTFFVEQASFKFYHFASFPSGESVIRAISPASVAEGTKDFRHSDRQAIISLVLDKRYDFKHVFISPAPVFQPVILPIDHYKLRITPYFSFGARETMVISMRGPPYPL
jgi:hypothetical protein